MKADAVVARRNTPFSYKMRVSLEGM